MINRNSSNVVTDSNALSNKAFIWQLLACTFITFLALVLFVQIVDPYGVSPIGSRIEGFNAVKPARYNIDRQIKPYEVWAKQPKTIFMGTSRIHQSINPTVLKGTELWPAYNASVPANTLQLNYKQLKDYIHLDPNLSRVYIEIYIYSFIKYPPYMTNNYEHLTSGNFLDVVLPLFVSFSSFQDSLITLYHNMINKTLVFEIAPEGNAEFNRDPGIIATQTFPTFPTSIFKDHFNGVQLDYSTFMYIDKITELCKQNNIELIFLATPECPDWDYYHHLTGHWDIQRELLHQISMRGRLFAVNRPCPQIYQTISVDNPYWHDPSHFSLEIGKLIQLDLLRLSNSPNKYEFLEELSAENIDDHIEARIYALKQWAKHHPKVVNALHQEQEKWDNQNYP